MTLDLQSEFQKLTSCHVVDSREAVCPTTNAFACRIHSTELGLDSGKPCNTDCNFQLPPSTMKPNDVPADDDSDIFSGFQPTPKDSLSDKDRGPAAPPAGEKASSSTSSKLQELVRPAHSEGGPTAGVVSKTKELVQRFRDTPGNTLRER